MRRVADPQADLLRLISGNGQLAAACPCSQPTRCALFPEAGSGRPAAFARSRPALRYSRKRAGIHRHPALLPVVRHLLRCAAAALL